MSFVKRQAKSAPPTVLKPQRGFIHFSGRFDPFSNPHEKRIPSDAEDPFLGAPGGVRTHDLPVRSRALYPLSYGRIVLPFACRKTLTQGDDSFLLQANPERLSIVAIPTRIVKRKNVLSLQIRRKKLVQTDLSST